MLVISKVEAPLNGVDVQNYYGTEGDIRCELHPSQEVALALVENAMGQTRSYPESLIQLPCFIQVVDYP